MRSEATLFKSEFINVKDMYALIKFYKQKFYIFNKRYF